MSPLADVVAITRFALGGVRRDQRLARLVDDLAHEYALRRARLAALALGVGGKLRLHLVPLVALDDRLVEARIDRAAMRDVAGVDRVLEKEVELAAGERPPAHRLAGPGPAVWNGDALRVQFVCQAAHVPQRQVAGVDPADQRGVAFDDGEAAFVGAVAKRRNTPHPHALGLGGRQLVADPLGGDLALELREAQQHVERQSPHAGGGVERLGDRDKAGARLVECFDQLGKVEQRARQPVDLVDDDDVDAAGIDLGKQGLQAQGARACRQLCRRRRRTLAAAPSLRLPGSRYRQHRPRAGHRAS